MKERIHVSCYVNVVSCLDAHATGVSAQCVLSNSPCHPLLSCNARPSHPQYAE